MYAPHEGWHQEQIVAGQVGVALSALNSGSFDSIRAVRAGSITGMATRLTNAVTDVNANSLVTRVTINGAAGTLQLGHSAGVNPTGGQVVQAAGVDAFVAGDLIGVQITTLGSYTPANNEIEVWLDLEE